MRRWPPPPRDCVSCGTPFVSLYWGKKTCSPECGQNLDKARREQWAALKPSPAERACDVCGQPFRPPTGGGWNRLTCSTVCAEQRFNKRRRVAQALRPKRDHGRGSVKDKNCPICGTVFPARPSNRLTCSPACRLEHRRRQERKRAAIQRTAIKLLRNGRLKLSTAFEVKLELVSEPPPSIAKSKRRKRDWEREPAWEQDWEQNRDWERCTVCDREFQPRVTEKTCSETCRAVARDRYQHQTNRLLSDILPALRQSGVDIPTLSEIEQSPQRKETP
jgi:predicted nucleic acid-binding Zn ribbon protein